VDSWDLVGYTTHPRDGGLADCTAAVNAVVVISGVDHGFFYGEIFGSVPLELKLKAWFEGSDVKVSKIFVETGESHFH